MTSARADSLSIFTMDVESAQFLKSMERAKARRTTLALTAMIIFCALPAWAVDLNQFIWDHRMLVLVAPQAGMPRHRDECDSPQVLQQLNAIASREDALIDRDLLLIQLYAKGQSRMQNDSISSDEARRLRKELGTDAESKLLILIGKDGSIKRRAPLDVDLSEIFRQIDSMPMRRSEMLRRIEAGGSVTDP